MIQPRPPQRALARQRERRARIVEAATRHFAEDGYEGARIDDIARDAGVAKGAVIGYFGSKAGLFLEVYKAAARSFDSYMDAPREVLDDGFFATLTYFLERTTLLVQERWVPYRISLLGNYCTDLRVRREITQFLAREDPYGSRAFIEYGIARGEVRDDIDPKVILSMFNWSVDACQDALVAEELDPGLFGLNSSPERTREYVRQFIELLKSAIGTRRPS